jgi:rubrerythrin
MSRRWPMTDREKLLFEAFKLAIDREREAQVDYGKLAELTEDPDIRGLFLRFQSEEAKHEQGLLRTYRDFKARFIPK